MRLHEQTGNAGRHRGTRENRDEFALSSRHASQPSRQLNRVRCIEDHRAIRFTHDRQTAHIRNEIVIAEGGTTLANHQRVGAAISLTGFRDDVFHIPRGEELTFLDVDRLATRRHLLNDVRLAAKKGGGM